MQLGAALARLFGRGERTYEGETFRAHAEGKGADALYIHGLAASPACWEHAASYFDDQRLHTAHIRGFAGEAAPSGRRPGNFLKPFVDELAVYLRAHAQGRASIVGHSMGGIAALMLARDHPELVDRLVIVDVPAFFSVLITPFATGSAMAGLAEMSRRQYLDSDDKSFEEHLRRTAQTLVRDPFMLERVVHWGLLSDRRMTADVMAEVMVTDLRGDLRRIDCPTLVIYGWDKASAATRAGLDQVYASSYSGLKGHRRLRIDDARHYVMLDQPAVFYRAVREWIGASGD